jgi:DNA adenine methylase
VRGASPLRYPGGKWRLTGFFTRYLEKNFETTPEYIEPYAGGASLAISLLIQKKVSRIWLNDLDPSIHACWSSILNSNERFCEAIETTPITTDEWRRQKSIYSRRAESDTFSLGFATFFLNRTNHSGILNAGIIGGRSQKGEWLIDARFNRSELVKRVRQIAELRAHIKLTCLDAKLLLARLRRSRDRLIYLDPPYVTAGKALYLNSYKEANHVQVRDTVAGMRMKWIVSYDDVPLVRRLYRGYRHRGLELLHTARVAKVGKEVLFFSSNSVIPSRAAFGSTSR